MLAGGEGKNTSHGSECVKALEWEKDTLVKTEQYSDIADHIK